MRINTEKMAFEVNDKGSRASFLLNGCAASANAAADFWRLILDDGQRTEIPVCSHQQDGRVRMQGDVLLIEYDRLLSEYGEWYDIVFRVWVNVEDGLLKFTPEIENHDALRVNECFCPLADFESLCGEKEKDVIYMPHGLGMRVENPWKHLQDMTSSYYQHDDREVFWHLHYPRASMGWFGIESGDNFLYVARYDEKMRYCFLTVRQTIHSSPSNLLMGVDHFPMARPGEKLTLPATVIGLLAGDWRTAARTYRAWADKAFFKVPEKAPWVIEMTGFQRIIMRSQYGEDYYKAEDLPAMYEAGAKHGIHTLFLFAWWKEGMDRNYPTYTEPYPGAFAALRENIGKVRAMGGRVILECNCHFLDPANPYYGAFGDEVKILDINGNEIRPSFVYPGRGEFRVTYGAKQFPICCAGTERWRGQVLSQLRLMRELDADCLFADCYGAAPYQPCFNDRHEHGPRVDEEWIYHRKFFDEAVAYCEKENRVFAVEIVTDIAAAYSQFIHGLVNVDFQIKGNAFPQLFRYTFPEVITTDRGIRDEEGDFDKRLKYALVMGMRLDAELYVCRADIGRSPRYAEAVGEHAGSLQAYGDFLLRGTFTVLDTSLLPDFIKRGEYYSADGDRVLRVLYNASAQEVRACGIALTPDEVRFDIFDCDAYEKSIAKGEVCACE